MAEYLLRQRLEQLDNWQGRIYSAGSSALCMRPADEAAVALMLDRSIDLAPHRANQVTQQQIRQADLVLVMENHHREAVLDVDPTARGKTYLLGYWNNTEIPDPYMRGDKAHARVLRLIEDGVTAWVEKMVCVGAGRECDKVGCNE